MRTGEQILGATLSEVICSIYYRNASLLDCSKTYDNKVDFWHVSLLHTPRRRLLAFFNATGPRKGILARHKMSLEKREM